jgi:hypothetical protein
MTEEKNRSVSIRFNRYLPLLLLMLLLGGEHARAQYIDPGSGSYILQVLIAGFLALAFYSRRVKDYVKLLYHRLFSKK